jgi:hypothetical protein
VAEGEEFGFQVGPTANDVPDSTEEGDQSSNHRSTLMQLHAEGKRLASQPRMEFSEGTALLGVEGISEGPDCARTVPRVCPTKVSWVC